MPLRQPIVVVLGHVDHGKTTLLDYIRGTAVTEREPGQITQWIGASFLPREVIQEICGPLLEKFRFEVKVPGLLFIDTPGHETFSNLRKRGGSAADIAILVIDAIKGVEPQTVESISILKSRKTPFVVAANKIDMIKGWRKAMKAPFWESILKQPPEVQADLDNRIYGIVGSLSALGFNSERYDRITDFTKTIAIVPTSAKTGEGVPELLAILVGLTQAFMKKELEVTHGPARGTVLEVKEEVGMGVTVNAIVYDGIIKVNDVIVLGGREAPITAKVRALLVPRPLDEIRDPREKFNSVSIVRAAAGVKIVAPDLDMALAGSPLYVVPKGKNVKEYARMVEEEVERIRIKTDKVGVVLKADTLGSLEAITLTLTEKGIPVRLADVGDVSKRDIVEAEVVKIDDRLLGAVLAFNVKILPDAEEEARRGEVPIFRSNIIYHLLEDYFRWFEEQKVMSAKAELEALIRPSKIRILPGFVFRRSKPAIVGVEVMGGIIKPKYPLIKADGRRVGEILRVQDKGEDIAYALKGAQVAISITEAFVGRNVDEGDLLYVDVPEKHAKLLLTRFADKISPEEAGVLNELIQIKRKENPLWAL